MFATAVRIEHDLGVPSVSLNALTGHCSCAPEDCSGLVAIPSQGPVPVSGVFPAGSDSRLLETRLQAMRLSPYRADLPARRPVRLGSGHRFPGMLLSPISLSGHGSAIRSKDTSSSPCPLCGLYSSAPRGARRLPGSGAADLPSDRRLWLGQTVDARVVCDGAEWIGGYGICRGEWSATGNVADADAAEVSCEVTGGWREVLGDGACSTGTLRGRLAQPNETRRCGAGFRLAVVTGDLEHSAVKGSPPRRDQRPGGGGLL